MMNPLENALPNGYCQPAYPYGNTFSPQYAPRSIQPVPQPSVIPGRFVNSPEDILPGEVYMDKNVYIFPCSDGQKITTKTWDNMGNLVTRTYLLEVQDDTKNNAVKDQESFENDVRERLQKIEKQLSSLSYTTRKQRSIQNSSGVDK